MVPYSSTKWKNDLLVDGYLREQEKLSHVSNNIPTSIDCIIFEYQLYVTTWNKQLSDGSVGISDDGAIIHFPSSTDRSLSSSTQNVAIHSVIILLNVVMSFNGH